MSLARVGLSRRLARPLGARRYRPGSGTEADEKAAARAQLRLSLHIPRPCQWSQTCRTRYWFSRRAMFATMRTLAPPSPIRLTRENCSMQFQPRPHVRRKGHASMSADAFSAPGKFYRGNLLTHSTRSDGKISPEEVCKRYRERGYDSNCLSDHFLRSTRVPDARASEPG